MERLQAGFFPVHSLISYVDAHGCEGKKKKKGSEGHCDTPILNLILKKLSEGKKERLK